MRRVVEPSLIEITGLILAGGQGSRMRGIDKGLVNLVQRPLISHVLERFAPQVHTVIISANRNTERYREFGYPVVNDTLNDYPGPLAGILSGLMACETEWLVSAPCDCPFMPHDLVRRLSAAVDSEPSIAVVNACGELQPVFALIPTRLRDSLSEFLTAGERKITRWFARHAMVPVDFGNDTIAFSNVNTPEELAAAEARFAPTRVP